MPASPSATMISLKHARPVGDRDDDAVQVLRRQAPGGQHAVALLLGAGDGVAEARRVGGGERLQHLLQALLELGQRGQQGRAVVEEDVGPHAPVAAGDAREVAEARARRESSASRAPACWPAWLMSTLASTCGRWLTTAIRRSCSSGSTATGRAPMSAEEVVEAAGRRRRRTCAPGREEVGGALVQRGARVGDAGGLRAAERVAADAAPLLVGRERPHERSLGAAHVGDDGVRRGGGERRPHVLDHEAHGRADEDQVGACAGLFEAAAGARDGAALEREVERGLRLAEAADLGHAGELPRREPERPAHEADADEGDGC